MSPQQEPLVCILASQRKIDDPSPFSATRWPLTEDPWLLGYHMGRSKHRNCSSSRFWATYKSLVVQFGTDRVKWWCSLPPQVSTPHPTLRPSIEIVGPQSRKYHVLHDNLFWMYDKRRVVLQIRVIDTLVIGWAVWISNMERWANTGTEVWDVCNV